MGQAPTQLLGDLPPVGPQFRLGVRRKRAKQALALTTACSSEVC